jgi:hypothetical protein
MLVSAYAPVIHEDIETLPITNIKINNNFFIMPNVLKFNYFTYNYCKGNTKKQIFQYIMKDIGDFQTSLGKHLKTQKG